MAKYVEKFSRLRQIIKENGGLMGSLGQLYRLVLIIESGLQDSFSHVILTQVVR